MKQDYKVVMRCQKPHRLLFPSLSLRSLAVLHMWSLKHGFQGEELDALGQGKGQNWAFPRNRVPRDVWSVQSRLKSLTSCFTQRGYETELTQYHVLSSTDNAAQGSRRDIFICSWKVLHCYSGETFLCARGMSFFY